MHETGGWKLVFTIYLFRLFCFIYFDHFKKKIPPLEKLQKSQKWFVFLCIFKKRNKTYNTFFKYYYFFPKCEKKKNRQ